MIGRKMKPFIFEKAEMSGGVRKTLNTPRTL
jgi:hypothetical protein